MKYEMCNVEQELTVKIMQAPYVEPIISLVPSFSSKKWGRSEPGNIHGKNCQLLAPESGTVDSRVVELLLHCLWWDLSHCRIITCICYNLAYLAEHCQLKENVSVHITTQGLWKAVFRCAGDALPQSIRHWGSLWLVCQTSLLTAVQSLLVRLILQSFRGLKNKEWSC